MAIILEEEKTPINWFSVLTTGTFIIFIFFVVYYLFFVQPPLIEKVLPINLLETVSLSQIQFDPGALINSEAFRALHSFGASPSIPLDLGRANPFLPFE